MAYPNHSDAPMNVWLITIGEPLSTDSSGGERLLRTGLLAQRLVRSGHEVDFWSSTFDHSKKQHRFTRDTKIDVQHGYRLRLLHANRYSNNVSLRRIANHRTLATKFLRNATMVRKPDVILCSLPTLELCEAATKYGQRFGVPVVLDVRDLWPDLLTEIAPQPLRPLARLALRPMTRQAVRACSAATAITGVTDEYINWGLGYAGRAAGCFERSFPMGYPKLRFSPSELKLATAFWNRLGIVNRSDEFIASWFGVMGRHSEIANVIQAARQLRSTGRRVRFVMCGVGPALEKYRRLAALDSNIVFPGWVNAAQIQTLLGASSVGLAPYVSNENYRRNVPNKPIEYLSAGLPIISSLQGLLSQLLADNDCGVTYANARADELARAIARLYDDPQRLRVMSDNALTLYHNRYVAEQVYDNMKDYLLSIVTQSSTTTAPRSRVAA